jgi:hypothetical protein
MLVKLSNWLLVLMLSLTIGLHWAFLQSVAWAGMVVTYSRATTLKEGIAKTFDGQHPCKLCKVVEGCKKSEKPLQVTLKVCKLDVFVQAKGLPRTLPPPTFLGYPADSSSPSRVETPLTPPPRGA